MRLKGKQALITGSSRGIGQGIALKLAQEGATIAVHYYRNHEAAADTLARIREIGSDGIIIQADVSVVDDIRRMCAEVRDTFGTLDIFVSHARSELATPFQVALGEVTPLMPNGGRILAITFAHSPAKAALETSVRGFAVALAARGITVNALNPGLTADSALNAGNVVALLCSDDASRITGQVIAADSGASLINPPLSIQMQLAQSAAEMTS